MRGQCEIGHTQCERDTLSDTHSETFCISETHTTHWDGNHYHGHCVYLYVCLPLNIDPNSSIDGSLYINFQI